MFAAGDRIMFLRNEKSLGVKNGTLGRVERIERSDLVVRLDGRDRREVTFSISEYADVDHGYAATIHKAQGVTVDRAHVLATSGLDRHAAYVAMTRHRKTVTVHFGRDQFIDRAELTRTLSRERTKDTALDYKGGFAARRGLRRPNDLELRADAFVKEWTALRSRMELGQTGDMFERRALHRDLRRLCEQLDRDPSLRIALAPRRAELGISEERRAQRRLADDLMRSLGRDRGLDR
jgi:hypothetical protein